MSNDNFKYQKSLFIFRRDLRLQDNCGLNQALTLSKQVIAGFIFDPRQISEHPYQSKPALQFMVQAITDLQSQFRSIGAELALFNQLPDQVIKDLVKQQGIQAVFINRDYTPFSRQRDYAIAELCRQLGIDLHYCADALLNEPEQATKSDHTPYKVFTAFYNNAKQHPVSLPLALVAKNFLSMTSNFDLSDLAISHNEQIMQGGRQQALAILDNLSAYTNYQTIRDFPAIDGTSMLSAHLKFGTCSVREVFYAVTETLGSEHPLIRQLYWRDFFTHIGFYFPHVFGKAFNESYQHVQWDNNQDNFRAWCTGLTGFPIVDAGMRQLNATGFMHNRVRMIVASFLVKDLHISWRWGERYFAQQLVDYDPCVNNGNWQWAASTGCDAQPYFRIFNPWLQQQKFDPDCVYIHRWVPELKTFSSKAIHQWYNLSSLSTYPAPIVDHAKESKLAKERYKNSVLDLIERRVAV
jgi:deoxyribodipyrimidine photo-lyase